MLRLSSTSRRDSRMSDRTGVVLPSHQTPPLLLHVVVTSHLCSSRPHQSVPSCLQTGMTNQSAAHLPHGGLRQADTPTCFCFLFLCNSAFSHFLCVCAWHPAGFKTAEIMIENEDICDRYWFSFTSALARSLTLHSLPLCLDF